MFTILPSTDQNYVAFKVMGPWSASTFEELYQALSSHYQKYGSLLVYEELQQFNFKAFLSSAIGVYHDLKYANAFKIDRLAIVSDSKWLRLLVLLWRKITFFWPVTAKEIRCFKPEDKNEAKEWLIMTNINRLYEK